MRQLRRGIIGFLGIGIAISVPMPVQATSAAKPCIAFDRSDSSENHPPAKCQGGPLLPGDQRLRKEKLPRTADRKNEPRHIFEIGGTSITISGSVRVDSTFSK